MKLKLKLKKKKRKFNVYGIVTGGKYIGQVEAYTKDEAYELGLQHPNCYVSVCHQCAREVGEVELDNITVEEVE